MSSRIEQIIDEIETYIDSCKPKFMSNEFKMTSIMFLWGEFET